jgi:glycosyltransferase involved in cell wall biosynthesis
MRPTSDRRSSPGAQAGGYQRVRFVSPLRVHPGGPRYDPGVRAIAFGSIVHVNEKGGSFGGTEEYIALLTPELTRRGVRSHLVCGVVTGVLPPELSSVHVVDGLASRRPRPDTADEVAAVVAGLDPDVVYLHNVFDATVVSAVVSRVTRGTVIWYVHDHYLTCLSELRWRRDLGSCPQRLGEGCLVAIGAGQCVLRHPDRSLGPADLRERMSLSRSMAHADGIVVVSEYMRRLLADAEPHLADRIHVVPRPIRDLGSLGDGDRHEPEDPTAITFAGRLTPEKGLAVLIEALGMMHGSGPVELRIAGVVENDAYWSQCQRLGHSARSANPLLTVTYLGHLDYPSIDELFRKSDVVAIPSQWPEPLGVVALEAMAAGAAVVASNIGGLDTALVHGQNGVLVDPPDDVAAWSAAIESQVHHPERARRLGRRAHHDVSGRTAADHVDVLDRIIAEAGRRGAQLTVRTTIASP